MTVRIMIAEDQTMVRQALVAAAALAQGDRPRTDRETKVLAAAAGHAAIADIAAGARNPAEAVQIAQQKGWL